MTVKHPEGTRVVYVGPTRDDIKETLGTVVLDAKDARNRNVVQFDDGASMSIACSDLITQAEAEAQVRHRGRPQDIPSPLESLTDEQREEFEVDPFAFRLWLIENTMLTEEQVTLNMLNRIFEEFRIFVKAEEG